MFARYHTHATPAPDNGKGPAAVHSLNGGYALAGCGKRSETRYGRNVLSVFSACVESTNNKPICTATFHPNRVFERITRCGEFEQWWMRR